MTREDKKKIERRAYLHDIFRQLHNGPNLPLKLFALALFFVGAVYVATKQAALCEQVKHIELISPILKAAMEHALFAYLLVGAAVLLALLLYPFGRRAAKDQLQCIGLINHAGMPPDLLRKHRDKDNPRVTVWEFRNQGIPLQEWEKKRPAIETALGITIVKLTYAKGKSRVLVYAVSAGDDLPEVLKWKDSYLSPKSFVLVLGESYTGPVTVNLAHIPHILLGGSTGSGKSVLLKLLLMQALHTIEVLMVEPGQYPRVERIGSDLASLQKAVDGYIEAIYPYDDPVALICGEEAKLEGKPLNRALRDEDGDIYDIVAGKFFICGLGDENFASLPKELQQKYEEKFRQPEAFLKMGSKIMAIPTEPAKAAGKGKTAPVTER